MIAATTTGFVSETPSLSQKTGYLLRTELLSLSSQIFSGIRALADWASSERFATLIKRL